jgi:hypothetical protein
MGQARDGEQEFGNAVVTCFSAHSFVEGSFHNVYIPKIDLSSASLARVSF